MEIRSFKLTTGEELIAQLVCETGLGYKVKSPLVVHVMRGPDGQGALAFAQWSMVQKPDVEIELLDHALCAVPVSVISEVADSYIQQTSSIIIAKNPSQILKG